jgi:hypothetical protein
LVALCGLLIWLKCPAGLRALIVDLWPGLKKTHLTSPLRLTIVIIIIKSEDVMTAHTIHEQSRLLAGLITHVSLYLDTGCPRAARRARMLLRRLDASDMDQELMTSCEKLDRAISRPRMPSDPGVVDPSSISRPPRSPSLRACNVNVSFPN